MLSFHTSPLFCGSIRMMFAIIVEARINELIRNEIKMKITFNQSQVDLKGNTIEDLLYETGSDKEQGFVVAVNNKIILKKYWESYHLNEADNVQTILPVHGG